MKTIKINQLKDMVAEKFKLTCDAQNFIEFKSFVDELYSQFGLRWNTLDDMVYYTMDTTVSDYGVTIPTEALKMVFAKADEMFSITDANSGCEFYGDENYDVIYDTPYEITQTTTYFNFCGYCEVSKFLQFWLDVSKQYNVEIKVEVGSAVKDVYSGFNLVWSVTSQGITAQNCYFEINDDNGEELMYSLYWLMQSFIDDTFEQFEQLGVELRYEQIAKE